MWTGKSHLSLIRSRRRRGNWTGVWTRIITPRLLKAVPPPIPQMPRMAAHQFKRNYPPKRSVELIPKRIYRLVVSHWRSYPTWRIWRKNLRRSTSHRACRKIGQKILDGPHEKVTIWNSYLLARLCNIRLLRKLGHNASVTLEWTLPFMASLESDEVDMRVPLIHLCAIRIISQYLPLWVILGRHKMSVQWIP